MYRKKLMFKTLMLLSLVITAAASSRLKTSEEETKAAQMLPRIVEEEPKTTEPKTIQAEPAIVHEYEVATAKPVQEPAPEAEPEKTYMGEFTATAYCPCEICCGEWANNRPDGIVYTASGAEAQEGITVAADWDVLPAGTHIEIEGLGERIVQDCPADWVSEQYGGRIIDIYFNDHDAALQYGRQTVNVWIIKEG